MILVAFEEVACESIVAWCENALGILAVLRRHPDKLPFRIPPETVLELEQIVTGWQHQAMGGCIPPARSYTVDELRQLVLYWFNISKLTEDERDRLGILFTPPAGRAFANALAAAVGTAMRSTPDLTAFVGRLEVEWEECQPSFIQSRNHEALGASVEADSGL